MSPRCQARHLGRQRAARGFTLVELMVAIALGLVLLTVLVSLIISSVTNRSELDKSSRQIENGRYSLETLVNDIQMAGFKGQTGIQSWDRVMPAACPANTADLGYTSTAGSPQKVPLPVVGLTDVPSCLASAASGANVKTGTGMLLVTRASSEVLAPVAAQPGEHYIQVSTCKDDPLSFEAGSPAAPDPAGGSSAAPKFELRKKDCSSSNLASLRKLVHRIYFISDCNECGKDTIPTLKVAEFINGSMVISPLVDGIDDLQFDYGIDMDHNGSPDCYVSAPGAPPSTEIDVATCPQTSPAYDWTKADENWLNVMAVRVHLLARNTEPSPGWAAEEKKRTYALGLAHPQVGRFDDNYKRHAFSTVARLINDSGIRELP